MTWIEINTRLLEMERNPSEDEEFKKEWDRLLSSGIAGILKRKKYEEDHKETRSKKPREKSRKVNNASLVHGDLERETPQV